MHPITIQILTFLLGAAALHGLYLSILLFFKNGKSIANRLLALSILAISLYLINYLFFLTEIILHFPHLLGMLTPALFLVGPGFYFFVKFSLNSNFRFRAIHLLHLLPFVYNVWRSIQVLQADAAQKITYIEQLLNPSGHEFSWTEFLMGTYVTYLLMAYVLAAWKLCKKAIANNPQDGSLKRINWLQKFCWGFIVLIISDLIIKICAFAFDIPAFAIEYLLAALIAIAIHSAGYFAIGSFPNFQSKNGKYKTSALTKSQIQACQKQLLDLLEKEKPFLQADLKIADLARLLQIPSHHLSQILSEGLQTNFFDLLNQYRIAEIKRRLVHPDFQHYSILAIALDCGFNNKATFNRVFKKVTGMTPSGFMAQVN